MGLDLIVLFLYYVCLVLYTFTLSGCIAADYLHVFRCFIPDFPCCFFVMFFFPLTPRVLHQILTDSCSSFYSGHVFSFLLSFLWACNVSACPDSTPNNMCVSLWHLCHYPTLNNFHAGLADRQNPSWAHRERRRGRREWEEIAGRQRLKERKVFWYIAISSTPTTEEKKL